MLRRRLSAARAARPATDRAAAGESLARHGTAAWSRCGVVAAFAGVGDEPPTRPLLDGLAAAGVRVLLPVLLPGGALDWGRYRGWESLRAARWGLREPAEADEADRWPLAEVVVVPALAVDRRGRRLGRGGGCYDRVLAGHLGHRVAVVFDDEVLDEVPVEPHDVTVDAVLTPGGLLRL